MKELNKIIIVEKGNKEYILIYEDKYREELEELDVDSEVETNRNFIYIRNEIVPPNTDSINLVYEYASEKEYNE